MTVHRNLNSRLKRKFIKPADQEDEQPRAKAVPLQAKTAREDGPPKPGQYRHGGCVANQFNR